MLGGNEFILVIASAFTSVWLLSNSWLLCGFLMFLACLAKLMEIIGSTINKVEAPEDFNVVIIGSGVAGICMGKKLNDIGVKYTVLEKSSRLGGTWNDNVYPGVGCDVPSHLYSFSFMMNPDWSRAYSMGSEINEYLMRVASMFGVYPNVQFNKKVVSCDWDGNISRWKVNTVDGTQYTANFVVSGTGLLHMPNVPNFKGKENFKGPSFHTALWDTNFNPAGKRVAVVGTGASSVQTVPSLVDKNISELKVFQRTPGWVPAKHDHKYPEWFKTMLRLFPFVNTIFRWLYFWLLEFMFKVVFVESGWLNKKLSVAGHNFVRNHYKYVIKDQEICQKLIPNFSLGCKRTTPSDTYLQAFNEEHVHLVTEGIDEIIETGIRTADGIEHEVDAIVYATGFDLQKSVRAFTVNGENGANVSDFWGDTPGAYLGITLPQCPNYFLMHGPGTALGHNSIIYMIECQANYATDAIKQFLEKKAKSMVVKQRVFDDYLVWCQERLKGKVFNSSGCSAWYKNARGVNWTLWPLDTVTYWWKTRVCNLQDFDIRF